MGFKWYDPFNVNETVSNVIPNEIKNAVPTEIVGVVDPVGIGGLNKNPSLANTLDPLNVSGKNTTGQSSSPMAVGIAGAAPTYDKTLLDTFNAQLAIQRPLLEANKLLQPEWLALQQQIQDAEARGQMTLMADLYKQAGTIEAAYQNQLRGNDLKELQTTLPQYQQAFNSLTPGYSQALSSTGQLAQQSMARSLQTPQLTAFENQVSSPYAVPMPAQQQAQQPPSQPQGTPVGGYVAGVQQYNPADISRIAGTPQSAGYLNTVGNAQQTAALAGNVPGMEYLSATPSAYSARYSAGGVPEGIAMQAAQTAAQAGGSAGTVPGSVEMQGLQTAAEAAGTAGRAPTTARMTSVMPAATAAKQAGKVTGPVKMAAAQSAAKAAAIAGNVPTSQNLAGARNVDAALQGIGAVPGAEAARRMQTAAEAVSGAGAVPGAQNLANIYGPQLGSGLENLNQDTVNQYLSAMPGMQDYARSLAQISQQELAAGRGLTSEEERMSQQAARAGYAARGTALGGQSVAAEVLNRADVANQRFQQRLGTAAQAATGIQAAYQPALAQSLQRQQAGLQYGLSAQEQAFGQAQTRDELAQKQQAQQYAQLAGTQATGFEQAASLDTLAQQQQAQQYAQALGAQTTGFEQAKSRDLLNAQLQAQKYGQVTGTQQAGFSQAQAQDTATQAAQAQRYAQAMGTQEASFGQAKDITALQQALQAQQYGQAMGTQSAGFEQAKTRDVFNQQTQAQRYAQAMGTQTAGFGQAQARDIFGRESQAQKYAQATGTQATGFGQAQARDTMSAQLQQQRYGQLMGAQGTAFEQAAAKETAAQQLQQQRYTQALGTQNFLQGAQGQAFNQAMGKEGLSGAAQETAFSQALQRGSAEQQRLQAGTTLQAGQAQLGAGAMGQLQMAQSPILNAYYQKPILQGSVGEAQRMGLANQAAAGNSLFNPESSMGFQSAFLPYNANIAMQTAGMQADASKAAGKSAMIGSIIGTAGVVAVGLCWVAREVYGTKTGTWKVFRSWLLNEAPEWLVNAYIKHGPDVAQFIADKPVLKSVIRRWMDSKIKSYLAA